MSQSIAIDDLIRLFKETEARFKETDARLDARFKETDARLDARIKETDARLDARFKETAAEFKETARRMSELQQLFVGQWGKLMESLVEGDLIKLLRGRNIDVFETSCRVKVCRDGRNWEFDIIAHNGGEIVVVEVKTTLRAKHVADFVAKLQRAREIMPRFAGSRIYGALAYLREEENAASCAENEGLFVIRATGNSARMTNPDGFQPKVF